MLETGTLLKGRFLIEQELARGGMGAVYLATDQKFGSRVAIKERFYEHVQLAEAFEREARLLNSLHHPILAHVSDYFSDDEGHFLVMEFIEGEDLCETLKAQGAFPIEDVVKWARELLDGLDYLHYQDPPVIHRDIKPGNLKLTSRGNIVLLDFGLAKETSGNTQGVRSVFGYSRRYSPLEQIEGAGTDARSDIFSLGATLFHLITGEAPADVLARASAIVASRPDPLKRADEVNPQVPSAIADVLAIALSLDANKRFASAGEMRTALDEAGTTERPAENSALPTPREPSSGERSTIPALAIPGGDSVGETAPPASELKTSLPVTDQKVRARNAINLSLAPVWQRPAVWAAVVLAAVLTLAYAGYRSTSGVETGKAPIETPQEQTVIDTQVNDQTPELTSVAPSTAEAAQPTTSENEIEPVKKTPARQRKTRVPSGTQTATGAAREPGIVERRTARSRQVPERTIRRQEAYQPPISSIETIFTGIPPQDRRRIRRPFPY